MSCQGRMKVVVRLQANADVGPALEKERQFFGNLVADGVARACVVGEERDSQDRPSMDGCITEGWNDRVC